MVLVKSCWLEISGFKILGPREGKSTDKVKDELWYNVTCNNYMIKWNSHMNKLSTKSDGNLIRVTDKKKNILFKFPLQAE